MLCWMGGAGSRLGGETWGTRGKTQHSGLARTSSYDDGKKKG
jgi:hypothetical protein